MLRGVLSCNMLPDVFLYFSFVALNCVFYMQTIGKIESSTSETTLCLLDASTLLKICPTFAFGIFLEIVALPISAFIEQPCY